MLQQLRETIRKNETLRRFVTHRLAPSGLFDGVLTNMKASDFWQERIRLARESSDNDHIPRVQDAGKLIRGKQVMHNGLRINCGSYHGPDIIQLLLQNRGVHEPQEERVFQDALESLSPGSVMVELGSYWAFYSMWFLSAVPRARAFMIEPEAFSLECGQRNFELNGLSGDFTHAFISREPRHGSPPTITVDSFAAEKGIEHIDILHSDIQGHEVDMLTGAKRMLDEGRVGYIFISTHSNELHDECRRRLLEREFVILADANLDESFSVDGILVGRAKGYEGIDPIAISKRTS